jgi:hypothetical protein
MGKAENCPKGAAPITPDNGSQRIKAKRRQAMVPASLAAL